MALVIKDRIKETSTTTGTGTITLAGASTGFKSFSEIGTGNTTYYVVTDGTDWEVGIGTVGSNSLSRDTILASTNSNTAVNFNSNIKDVFCTYPADKAVYLDASGNIDINGGTVDGRDVSADGTKLDTIETNADVTDTANVTAAGALMDSEVTNLAAVKAFDPADYATAAQGSLADSALQDGDTVASLDINGGTIDGVTIGGASAGAGTFTNLTATGTVTLGGTALTATTTELNYTDGVTSNIQTQIDAANANSLAFAIALG